MRKPFVILALGLTFCFLALVIVLFMKKQLQSEAEKNQNPPPSMFSKSSKMEFILPKKMTPPPPASISTYGRERLVMKERELFLVYDLTAAPALPAGALEVHRANGLVYYHNPNRRENNVVYDKARDRYGLLTGEISVKGSADKIQAMADKYNLEIIYQGKMGELFILKTPSLDFFSTEFAHFTGEEGIQDARPDIQFARLKSQ